MMILSKSRFFDLLADHLAKFEVDDTTGKITWVTRRLEQMFGYTRQGELEGKTIEVLVPDAVKDKHVLTHRPTFYANPEPRMMGRNLKLHGQKKDNSLFPVEVLLIPCAADGIRVTIGIIFDMSGRG